MIINNLELVFTPNLLPFYDIHGKAVVIVDIFRATTAICAALSNEVVEIIPVKTVEEALSYKNQGYILASERQGEKIDGFDLGNSPEGFLHPSLKGKTIILSTTNGTNAILSAAGAELIFLGSFLNITSLANTLLKIKKDVIILCAGWQNKFNLEDTVFGGALIEKLGNHFDYQKDDSSLCGELLYNHCKNDIKKFLLKSSHYNRLKHLNLEADLNYSLRLDETDIIPFFDGKSIRPFKTY